MEMITTDQISPPRLARHVQDRKYVFFEHYRDPKHRQGASWVLRQIRQKHNLAVLMHLHARHQVGECRCGISTQEILDRMDWEGTYTNPNSFNYHTAHREYYRILEAFPRHRHLNFLHHMLEEGYAQDILRVMRRVPDSVQLSRPLIERVLSRRLASREPLHKWTHVTFTQNATSYLMRSPEPSDLSYCRNDWERERCRTQGRVRYAAFQQYIERSSKSSRAFRTTVRYLLKHLKIAQVQEGLNTSSAGFPFFGGPPNRS